MHPPELRAYSLDLATRIVHGHVPSAEELAPIATAPDTSVGALFPGVAVLRAQTAPRGIQLCSICNVKSGLCSEDCLFCTQSRGSAARIDVHSLLDADEMADFLVTHSREPLNRAALVSSGRRPSRPELRRLTEALHRAKQSSERPDDATPFCASLGLLDEESLAALHAAGLTRYHCNLETARSHFASLCSTHSYDDKLATIHAARRVGLGLCVGGLFGVGETDLQVLELGLELRALAPDAVPVNFLVSVPGAPLAAAPNLTPARCLRIIALLRYTLPRQDILVCGGRMPNLLDRHVEVFAAGATGLMTGNYLTTLGRTLEEDLRLLEEVGETARQPWRNSGYCGQSGTATPIGGADPGAGRTECGPRGFVG